MIRVLRTICYLLLPLLRGGKFSLLQRAYAPSFSQDSYNLPAEIQNASLLAGGTYRGVSNQIRN